MKRYQIAILSFALGIFAVTSFGVYFIKKVSEEIIIPQKTSLSVEYKTVHIFFSSTVKDPETLHCDKVYPVQRAVSRLSDNERSALAEYAYLALSKLIDGPAGYEKDNGYFTSISN